MASFKLRRFTNPDLLKTIAQGRLLEFLRPWRDYLASRGLEFPINGSASVDCDALAHILIDPDATVPKDMIGALYCIDETASTEDMEALLDLAKSRGVDLEDDPGKRRTPSLPTSSTISWTRWIRLSRPPRSIN